MTGQWCGFGETEQTQNPTNETDNDWCNDKQAQQTWTLDFRIAFTTPVVHMGHGAHDHC